VTIDGSTVLVGIIGQPVSHSLSPAIHNAAFAACGINMAYVPLPVAPDRLGAAVEGLRALGFRGANVTIPHKTAVVEHLDGLAAEASLVAAVNTIVVDGDVLWGHNTDVEGFRRALREVEPGPLAGWPCLLVGAGGAARAAALALVREGAHVTVANRTLATALDLVALLDRAGFAGRAAAVTLESVTATGVAKARLIVNATPLGMAGAGKVPAVLADNVTGQQIVYDVVYAREPSHLIAAAHERGARTVDGLEMLLWQAAAAFELWTGRPAPVEVMRGVVAR
jgi:shikimate dehydrogenase